MQNFKRIFFLLFIISIINFGKNLFQNENKYFDNEIALLEQNHPKENIYSNKRLGSFVENDKTIFRLFAPSAESVVLILFNKVEDNVGKSYQMNSDEDGVWEYISNKDLSGKYYGYKVISANNKQLGIRNLPLCVDPYAKAVATYTTFMNPRKSIVYSQNFDWENDEWIKQNWHDLIIYEMHIRDLTAHQSSKSSHPGTYRGLVEKGKNGGIDYIKQLGINTVELLPAMEFATMEIPYKDSLYGKLNTWNPYERNHWGYMTSNFFAPAAYYAEDWKTYKRNTWMGAEANQVNEFKNMVKAFHKEGIAVIMDVVFNHLSEYELGNLKQIDKDYYFRLNDNGTFKTESYCGNDLKTEAPMMRRLIVESILFWMQEYHIDGFRFDLGKLLDWETIEAIIYEARKINPSVVFVCEPWGGEYDPKGFSLRDWGAWNDQIRNGIKGENPNNGQGWIFGKWYGDNSPCRIKSYVNGTLIKDSLGLFQKAEHSVNYLESHDGYTLGDFIRIGLGDVPPDQIISNVDEAVKLSGKQLALNKLAALFLFTSRGITMIHEGQEFARTKVIPVNAKVDDQHQGMIDHNTYDKDNEVNYLNFNHAQKNKELLNYYKGLIKLRKKYSAFRRAEYNDVKFLNTENNDFSIGYTLTYDEQTFTVFMNADQEKEQHFNLPPGEWEVIVDSNTAGINKIKNISKEITIKPISGVVLKKK